MFQILVAVCFDQEHAVAYYLHAGRLAARHLLDAGHGRIGIISGPGDVASMGNQCEGARALIAAEGELAFRVENAFSVDMESPVIDALLHGGATAIFAAADVIAIGALRHARSLELRVPGDLSILGFDDIPLAEQQVPPLSTIELPVEIIAPSAIDALLAQVDASTSIAAPTATLVAIALVARATVGAPRSVPTWLPGSVDSSVRYLDIFTLFRTVKANGNFAEITSIVFDA